METEKVLQMKAAVDERRRARRLFMKARNASSLCSLTAIPQSEKDWGICEPLQRSLLKAEMKVFKLAISGVFISDIEDRKKKFNSKEAATLGDISHEIDILFTHVGSRPSQKVRQYLNKSTISDASRKWARGMLIRILHLPLETLFEIGDMLASPLLEHVGNERKCQRLRLALIRVLMYISDSLRYSFNEARSKAAAELMRLIAPGDAEAHMRIGMNLPMIDNTCGSMRPFFHYCVFLANRNVPIGHNESVVVSNLVKDAVRIRKNAPKGKPLPARTRFFCFFIETLWSVLSTDFEKASAMVTSEQLWCSLTESIDSLSDTDMLHVVGALMFTQYRVSPQGCADSTLLPERELTDILICKLLTALCRSTSSKLEPLIAALRSRKRNRRRAMQKKRRLEAQGVQTISAEALGCELFRTMVNMDKIAPHLGAASFLAHYWSKARMAPSPSADLTLMARTLQTLQSLIEDLSKVEEITATRPLTAHIGSKILVGVRHRIPALPEDISFSNFLPCTKYDMFSMVLLQEVPLAKVLDHSPDGTIKAALHTMRDTNFESLVATTSRRHLDAFSYQSAKEASEHAESLGKEAASTLVALTLRRLRLMRLIRDLEKVAGGKLTQMWNPCSSDLDGAEDSQADNLSDHPPPAGQLNEKNTESLNEHLTSEQLGAQVRKRQRLIGNCCTPGKESGSGGLKSGLSCTPRLSGNSSHEKLVANSNEVVLKDRGDNNKRQKRPVTNFTSNTPSARGSSHGGFFSQGSIQLCYAQPIEPCSNDTAPPKKCINELSHALRQALYPSQSERSAASSQMGGLALWRRFPKDDLGQDIFNSQASC